MAQTTTDHQTARRRAAMWMFVILVGIIVGLVLALIFSISVLPKDDDFVRGIVLTAIAGAISSALSFVGLIVKGIVDKLTREEQTR